MLFGLAVTLLKACAVATPQTFALTPQEALTMAFREQHQRRTYNGVCVAPSGSISLPVVLGKTFTRFADGTRP
jgi:hypothetical protein